VSVVVEGFVKDVNVKVREVLAGHAKLGVIWSV